MATHTERGRGRPADPTIRDRLVAAAWELFLRQGVEATSIAAIAAAAHVSKVTLYRFFMDKTALFTAGMQAEQARLVALRGAQDVADDGFEQRLLQFGRGTVAYLTAPDAVAFYAVLAGELRRHPALAAAFYDVGPGHTHTSLTDLIRHAAEAGEVRIDDPADAAEQLFGAWQGFSNFQLALGTSPDAVRIAALARVETSVHDFIRQHARPRSETLEHRH